METLNLTLRLLAASQFILMMLIIGLSQTALRVRLVNLALISGILSYLVMPWVETLGYRGWQESLWFPASSVPSLLLISIWYTFEGTQLPKWIMFLTGFSVSTSLWLRFHDIGLPESPAWLQILKLGIVLTTMAVVLYGRDSDLIERRQKLRNTLALTLTALILMIAAIEFATEYAVPLKLDSLAIFSVFTFSLFMNLYFAKLGPKMELVPTRPDVEAAVDDPLIDELLERMTTERLYADHDLRVGTLAALLNTPEYQLRKKINQQLGYQNFNQFINHYRIKEAGQRLLADKRAPVLSIALDVGFRSISSFNTAFQREFGVAATHYRNQN